MSEELNNNEEQEINSLIKMLEDLNSNDDETTEINYNSLFDTIGLDFQELENEIQSYVPKLDVSYKKSNENTIDPKYVYESDSGFDLYSVENMWIHPFDRVLIPTGHHVDIPDGYEIQVRSKSGLALKQGLIVLNSHGTVDQGYTGEIQVIVFNTSKERVKIEKGQKIAQAVLCPVVSGKWINLVEKKEINSKDRNEKGLEQQDYDNSRI